MLKIGSPAPLFEGKLDDGKVFKLGDHIGKYPIILYFYPRDNTPFCTKQACLFRDNYAVIQKMGGRIFGISTDSEERHQKFKAQFKLNFPLIADEDKHISNLYEARALFGLRTRRVTYVIGPDGKIADAFRSEISMPKHIELTVEALKRLKA